MRWFFYQKIVVLIEVMIASIRIKKKHFYKFSNIANFRRWSFYWIQMYMNIVRSSKEGTSLISRFCSFLSGKKVLQCQVHMPHFARSSPSSFFKCVCVSEHYNLILIFWSSILLIKCACVFNFFHLFWLSCSYYVI